MGEYQPEQCVPMLDSTYRVQYWQQRRWQQAVMQCCSLDTTEMHDPPKCGDWHGTSTHPTGMWCSTTLHHLRVADESIPCCISLPLKQEQFPSCSCVTLTVYSRDRQGNCKLYTYTNTARLVFQLLAHELLLGERLRNSSAQDWLV
jgi:hypothetical protein